MIIFCACDASTHPLRRPISSNLGASFELLSTGGHQETNAPKGFPSFRPLVAAFGLVRDLGPRDSCGSPLAAISGFQASLPFPIRFFVSDVSARNVGRSAVCSGLATMDRDNLTKFGTVEVCDDDGILSFHGLFSLLIHRVNNAVVVRFISLIFTRLRGHIFGNFSEALMRNRPIGVIKRDLNSTTADTETALAAISRLINRKALTASDNDYVVILDDDFELHAANGGDVAHVCVPRMFASTLITVYINQDKKQYINQNKFIRRIKEAA